MVLFVLMGEVDYEFSETLGVYSSAEAAERAKEDLISNAEAERGYLPFDRYNVLEVELDAAAVFP